MENYMMISEYTKFVLENNCVNIIKKSPTYMHNLFGCKE